MNRKKSHLQEKNSRGKTHLVMTPNPTLRCPIPAQPSPSSRLPHILSILSPKVAYTPLPLASPQLPSSIQCNPAYQEDNNYKPSNTAAHSLPHSATPSPSNPPYSTPAASTHPTRPARNGPRHRNYRTKAAPGRTSCGMRRLRCCTRGL